MSEFHSEVKILPCQSLHFPMWDRKGLLSQLFFNYLITFLMVPRPTSALWICWCLFGTLLGIIWEKWLMSILHLCLQGLSQCLCRINTAQVYVTCDPQSSAVYSLKTTVLIFHLFWFLCPALWGSQNVPKTFSLWFPNNLMFFP